MSSPPTPRSEPLPRDPDVPAEPQAAADFIKSMSDTSSDDMSVRGTAPAREPAVPPPNAATSGKAKSQRASPRLPESFGAGRYRVERLLGRGGMGAVYFATDTRLNRPVAVKVPKLDDLAPELAEKALRRFQREVQAAAALAHPYVCHVYDVGDDDGVPFLAMEFIDGQPLSEQIQRPWPLRSAAELIAKVAEGIAAAHAKGIVHRDLKPANIMLDARGEPKVMDFGLAKRVDGDKLTRTGAMLGTPQYMPKEQVLGESHKIGPWTDVYSLGVILYELLTARLPFDGHTVPQLLGRLLSTEAIKPRDIRPDIDLALEAICLRGIGKEIAHRYASMTEFSAALHEYLGPTGAAPPPNVVTASLPLPARERAKVKDDPPPQNTKPKPNPTIAETSAPPRRAKTITDSTPVPMPITVSPFCPWCAEPFGEIESCRTEPIECRQCRNVWLISDDGTKWNQSPKPVEAEKPSPTELAPPTKLPAADLASAEDHGPPSDSPVAPARSATQFSSPTRPTVPRRTLSRRQWIGVSVAALLLVIVTMEIVSYRARNTVPGLIALLADDENFRSQAAYRLGQIGPDAKEAIPALIVALKDTDPGVRSAAAYALGRIGHEAIPALIAALKDENDYVQISAKRAIKHIGREAVPILIATMKDVNDRWTAMYALGEIGPEAKEAVPDLIVALKDENVGQIAAYALGRIGPDAREAVPALITAMKDPSKNVQQYAAYALGRIGPDAKEAVPVLIIALKYANLNVRQNVENALIGIGPPAREAVPALIAAWKDADENARWHAANALGGIGPDAKEAVPVLITGLKDSNDSVRRGAAKALGKIGPDAKEAVPALIAALNDADENVRPYAAYALGRIGPDAQEAVPVLIMALKYANLNVRQNVENALVGIGRKAVPALIAALKDADENVRQNAVNALGGIGPDAKDAVPALILALKDANRCVQSSAVCALGGIGPAAKSAIPALEECLQGAEAGSAQTTIRNAISEIKKSK